MSIIIPLATVQSIREAGYNEAWLQDMIWQNPSASALDGVQLDLAPWK